MEYIGLRRFPVEFSKVFKLNLDVRRSVMALSMSSNYILSCFFQTLEWEKIEKTHTQLMVWQATHTEGDIVYFFGGEV